MNDYTFGGRHKYLGVTTSRDAAELDFIAAMSSTQVDSFNAAASIDDLSNAIVILARDRRTLEQTWDNRPVSQ